MRNANYIVHQKIAMMQLRQAVLFCYLQLLRQFLINYVTDAKGGVTTFVYDEDGRMTRQTDTEGKAVTYAYDTDGRLVSTTDGNGNTISNVYENASASSSSCSSCSGIGTGQPSKTVFPTFTRQYAYDTRGRKVTETDVLTDTQTAVSYSYDTSGNLTSKTDKEGKATSYEYDALRRLTKVTDAQGQTTTYTYDNRDNLTSLTDAKGQTTTFTYDKNNRLISETRPMGQQTGYQYNATGLLIKKTDAKGQRIEYAYDNANRMAQIAQYNSTGGNVKNISFTYDSTGNLKTYSDGTTSATYTYDELYRKTQETVNYGSFSLTTGYAYNKNGTKKNFTYPNGTTVNYTYDANNQLTGVNVPYAGNISYDAYQWTRPTGITLPSGSGAKQYAYDELMRTKTITSNDSNQNALMNYQYSYDKMDNIKTRNTQTGNYAYNYDNLYRLNEVKKDDTQTENYTYDAVGNRLTSATTTGDWTYNSNNELLSTPLSSSGSTGGSSYSYDANGNTIQRTINGQVQNFVYDVDNRLIEVRDAGNNLIAAYTYDPFGRRIKKQTGVNGQPLPSPLAGEGQGEGVITTYYLYSDEGLIGEYDNTGSQIKIYGYKPDSTWSTDPLFMREGGNIYFYHNDHLGTPQKMTDISGNVVWSATYDAFGKATVDASSTITSNLRFPGQYFDAETGLHYNWFRFYDPNTGRYITVDLLRLDDDYETYKNSYQYTEDDSINYYDPEGLYKKKNNEIVLPNENILNKITCIEKELGFELLITDGKRPTNPKYGASKSMHIEGKAVDVRGKGLDACKVKKAAEKCGFNRICQNKKLKHIHMDVKGGKYNCRDWERGSYIDPCCNQKSNSSPNFVGKIVDFFKKNIFSSSSPTP